MLEDEAMGFRVAVDIGGTFTDAVVLDEATGNVSLSKSSTTPASFADGVLDTLVKAAVPFKEVAQFVHGSTVVINALTERKIAKTGLLTSKGFRDILEIQRCNRPDMYNLYYEKPKAFVERRLRLEVDERVDCAGNVVRELREEDVEKACQKFRAEGVQAVAVCLVNSYASPTHEKRCAEIIKKNLPGMYVSLSSDLTREYREYERTSTTVLNACVQPRTEEYLSSLETRLRSKGVVCILHAMQSNAGATTFERAKNAPIHMVESGPVGGAVGASAIGKVIGEGNIMTFDVGGTTVKTTLIEQGNVKVTTSFRLESSRFSAGYPLKIPIVDDVEIGAGGGSIAWVDEGGALQVGPVSAGADPGPACYGKGGKNPTICDANLIAGRINAKYFLGGEMSLDVGLAKTAIEKISTRLKVDLKEAARGILRIANAKMIGALKTVSLQRGYDTRDFTVMAYGGGGGQHVGSLARELRIKKAIIPRAPAHFSAWGMLMTDLRHDLIKTEPMLLPEAGERIGRSFEALQREVAQQFSTEHIGVSDVLFQRSLDMRYVGQDHTVEVPIPSAGMTIDEIGDRFHSLHEREYTFKLDTAIEILNFHLVGFGVTRKPELTRLAKTSRRVEDAVKGRRDVDYDEEGIEASPIYERDLLTPGMEISGPAIVEEPASATVVNPGQTLTVDDFGDLIIHTGV